MHRICSLSARLRSCRRTAVAIVFSSVGTFGFPASKRIKKRQDFSRIQQGGKKIYSRHFVAALCEPRGEGPLEAKSRLGITVTRKVDKRAVARNYLKRRVREVFRLKSHLLKKPVDMVIIARRGAVDLEYGEIADELCQMMKRGKLCKPSRRPIDR